MFNLEEFHRRAWDTPFEAATEAKQTVAGAAHLQMSCDQCHSIASYFLSGLSVAGRVR